MQFKVRPHPRAFPSAGLLLATFACGVFTFAARAQDSARPERGNHGGGSVSVLTYHNDNMRTGQNTQEPVLTPANVNVSSFGKIGFFPVDGKVDAEPLYVANEKIKGGRGKNGKGGNHNVLYVVTEHDTAYAFDADTGSVLWQASMLGGNEMPSDPRNCGQVAPEIGITSTPVIDPSGRGAIYLVAMSKDASGHYYQRLHALDMATGQELPNSPVTIQASYPSYGPQNRNGQVIFDPAQYKERAALLLVNGVVYLSWASHCDHQPYSAWVMGYDEHSLRQTSVIDLTPNGEDGSVWQAGAGPAADQNGNIYFLMANGTFDTQLDSNGFPSHGDYGNAFMELSTRGNQLAVADYFNMTNTVQESNDDEDLGSGGPLLLPAVHDQYGRSRQVAVGAGKDANIYVVDRTNMGRFHPNSDNIFALLKGSIHGRVFSSPAYWNSFVYYGAVGDSIRSFATAGGTPTATAHQFSFPGSTPSLSSNGTSNGILWAVDSGGASALFAYDAMNLNRELYDSNQNRGRDQLGAGNKFITPMIANGKVFVGTANGVAVFGLLQ